MSDKFNLQDRFLNHLRINKTGVKIFLMNGFQIHGKLKSFDMYSVLVEEGKHQSLIFKHAISTIQPDEYVVLEKAYEGNGNG
ncbi:MAG TPA: RNA chaperone Hfq [Thermotogota bacterium]|nr:RNA chaperone Hfq [Thermotogota bacterium]HPJ88995.1 RNA chaperone Hfq [Thermotogota bacterium]HPR95506.1 RNA chaperone Hfq [Thermotogota bacterium]